MQRCAVTQDLAERRAELAAALGPDAVVDAAATVANYQRMVRIADGCGIPLDQFTDDASAPWREQLGVNDLPLGGEHVPERGSGVYSGVIARSTRTVSIAA